jgi:hypothetical protein
MFIGAAADIKNKSHPRLPVTDTRLKRHHPYGRKKDFLNRNLFHTVLFTALTRRMEAGSAIKALVNRLDVHPAWAPFHRIGWSEEAYHRSADCGGNVHGAIIVSDKDGTSLQHGGKLEKRRPSCEDNMRRFRPCSNGIDHLQITWPTR